MTTNPKRFIVWLIICLNMGMCIGAFARSEMWIHLGCAILAVFLTAYLYYTNKEGK